MPDSWLRPPLEIPFGLWAKPTIRDLTESIRECQTGFKIEIEVGDFTIKNESVIVRLRQYVKVGIYGSTMRDMRKIDNHRQQCQSRPQYDPQNLEAESGKGSDHGGSDQDHPQSVYPLPAQRKSG